MKKVLPMRAIAILALGSWVTAVLACAGTPDRVVLEPSIQAEGAAVDVEAGTVTMEREGVVVTAQGAMLPAPRGDDIHPTFWVTVENRREEPVAVRPAAARLIDSFGNQVSPVPVSVDRGADDVRYALVDPEIHTYVALHFGWPYYPLYPYRGWFAYPRMGRVHPWRYDPFWVMGPGPVWIMDVRPRPVIPRRAPLDPEREEIVYRDAKITYVVVFPQLDRTVRDVRLIVPGVSIRSDEERGPTLDFELLFRQIVEVGGS
jgi:hypothetical protein